VLKRTYINAFSVPKSI